MVVVQVHAVVELGEFEEHFDDLGLVVTAQAVMLGAAEYPLNALVDHFWADRILAVVQAGIERRVLLRQNENSFELLRLLFEICFLDCVLYIGPNVRSVVSIQVNDLLLLLGQKLALRGVIVFILAFVALLGDGVQIILVSLAPDDVDGFVHANPRVLLTVSLLVLGQDAVVRNLDKLNLDGLKVSLAGGKKESC